MNVFIPAIIAIFMVVMSKPETKNDQPIHQPTCSAETVAAFDGQIMMWNNTLQKWSALTASTPENVELGNMWFGTNHIFANDKDHQTHIFNTKNNTWSIEDPTAAYLQSVNGRKNDVWNVYETEIGIFASILHQGLVFKKEGGSFWKPVALPEFVKYVHDITFDIKSSTIFLTSPEGIFTSNDMGGNWQHVYMNKPAGNIIFSNGKCVAGTQGGILYSDDLGKSWKKEVLTRFDPIKFENHVPFFQVMESGYEIIALGGREGVSQRLWKSNDFGNTWTLHIADEFVTPLQNVSTLIQHDGELFCNHKEGISQSSDNGITWKLVLRHANERRLNTRLEIQKVGQNLYVAEVPAGC